MLDQVTGPLKGIEDRLFKTEKERDAWKMQADYWYRQGFKDGWEQALVSKPDIHLIAEQAQYRYEEYLDTTRETLEKAGMWDRE